MQRIKSIIFMGMFLSGCALGPRMGRSNAEIEISPSYKIDTMLAAGQAVRLAILVIVDPPDSVQRTLLATSYESAYLLKNSENLKVVDRYQIDEILKELHFQAVGMVPADMRLEIGKITGATHILYVSFSLVQSANPFAGLKPIGCERLICVETGDVIGTKITSN